MVLTEKLISGLKRQQEVLEDLLREFSRRVEAAKKDRPLSELRESAAAHGGEPRLLYMEFT